MSETPLPQGDQKTVQVRAMFDAIAPRYEMVNRVMTLVWIRAGVAGRSVICASLGECSLGRRSGHR